MKSALLLCLLLAGCGSIQSKLGIIHFEKHRMWMMPTTYEVTDGTRHISFYPSNCRCCGGHNYPNQEAVGDTIIAWAHRGVIDWEQVSDEKYADAVLHDACIAACNHPKGEDYAR